MAGSQHFYGESEAREALKAKEITLGYGSTSGLKINLDKRALNVLKVMDCEMAGVS